jgi:hypothetical protein
MSGSNPVINSILQSIMMEQVGQNKLKWQHARDTGTSGGTATQVQLVHAITGSQVDLVHM